ncbi:starch synthase [Palleronia marisminoris]|uniref:Glycogen synthase n=1 Tax=Palleronia marisminoris TaxID=315423 RepID=A0A1Y5TFS3_9RHOB|nr:glycogen synthase GlgA [Palleronia marisminoris]SFH37753.1 starch synthase [Palleronia marisminoris]SLN62762.1 Glycogen synthase 1 [Palleronia marisminoris]
MTRVLSVASECAPLIKTGGLADVAGALPRALAARDVEMRTLLPGYPAVMKAVGSARVVHAWDDLYGGPARLIEAEAAGLRLYVLEAAHLYDRSGGIYLDADGVDWTDNAERFAALCRAGAEICCGATDWQPDIAHGHDWQAGLLPYFLKKSGTGVPSVMTIHNIAFAGMVEPSQIDRLGLDPADFHVEGYEFWGRVSFLKAGLVWCDRITTVSPRYARELTTPAFGMGFEGLISARSGDLTGILNGIDTQTWNPATDPAITRFRSFRGKTAAVRALRDEMGLPASNGPLAVVISRLSAQKGLDLLIEALPDYLAAGGQLALLGSGDRALESAWREAAERHDGVAVRIGYDEDLSHRMMAGGEAVLVPSRFEPCGLTQLYGLRYGAIPVVARVGGLADTVIDANDAALRAGVATGIVHGPDSVEALSLALTRMVELHATPETWSRMARTAMRHPVGWDVSAGQYADLYRDLVPS